MIWKRNGDDVVRDCKVYTSGALLVLLADENSAEYRVTKLRHLSISHPYRYPSWDEISDARYALIPNDITMVMYLPPRMEYVNIHHNCFHLYESKEETQ